jgi:hypothetical protein
MPYPEVIEDPLPGEVIEDLPEAQLVSIDPPKKQSPFQQQAAANKARIEEEQKAPGTALGRTGQSLIGSVLGSVIDPLVDVYKGAETNPQEGAKPTINRLGDAALGIMNTLPGMPQFNAVNSLAGSAVRETAIARGTPYATAQGEGDVGSAVAFLAQGLAGIKGGAKEARTPVVDPANGKTVLKNPAADLPLQDEHLNIMEAKGVNPLDSQALKDHVAVREGVDPKQVDLTVDPNMPISKTELDQMRPSEPAPLDRALAAEDGPPVVKVQIEPGTPGEVATRIEHEVGNHVPEKLGMRDAPVEDNNALVAEGIAKEKAAWAEPVEPGEGYPGPHMPDSVNPALDAIRRARTTLQGGVEDLTRQGDIVLQDEKAIAAEGTIRKEARVPFREAADKPEVENLRISPADVTNYGQDMLQKATALREANRAIRTLEKSGPTDPLTRLSVKMARDNFEDAVARWNSMRFGGGHIVGRFDKALSEAGAGADAEVDALLRQAGVNIEGGQLANQALYTEGFRSLMRGEGLDAINKLSRGAALNLFSTFSFTMDAIGSVYRHVAEATGGIGRDMYWLAKGHPNFPNIGAFFRAIREEAALPPAVARELSSSLEGQAIPGLPVGDVAKQIAEGVNGKQIEMGSGALTHRTGLGEAGGVLNQVTRPISQAADTLAAGPAYLKKAVDSASGLAGGRLKMSALAQEAANRAGLRGLAREPFIKDFLANPPKSAVDEILRTGNELQWKAPVTKLETAYINNPVTRLFIEAFPSWPSQAVRGIGDTLGIRPATWKRLLNSNEKPLVALEMIGKAATGWGVVAFANHFYPQIDFDSMEYVNPDGGRTRWGSADPVPEIFALLALVHGDTAKAAAAIKNASIPLVGGLARQSGLLRPMANTIYEFANKGYFNAVKAQKDLTDWVNTLVPGQAFLAMMKSFVDPIARSGVGANIPIASSHLPAKVEATTGEESYPTQRPPGWVPLIGDARFRALQGAPLRGMTRETDNVYELLDYYVPEAIIKSTPRTPFAGMPLSDMPQEWKDEYTKEFGRLRWKLLNTKDHGALAPMFNEGRLTFPKGSPQYEKIRKRIQRLDSRAAMLAQHIMKRKYGTAKPGRKLSFRESSGASDTYDPTANAPIDEPIPDVIENEAPIASEAQ